MSKFDCKIMILWCSFVLMSIQFCHGSSDSVSSISYELDQAALEIMRQYDIAEDVRRSNLRRTLQHGFRQDMVFRRVLGLQKLKMKHPSDIVKLALDMGAGKQEHLLAVANHYQSKNDLNSTVDLYRFDANARKFVKFHHFTEVGPFKLEFLTVTSKNGTKINLLAIGGNSKISDKASATSRVIIYVIKVQERNITFKQFQSFSAAGGVDAMKSFERHNLTYLVLGMRLQSSMIRTTPAQVLVLVYNSEDKEFEYHSIIAANFISDIEIFPVGDMILMTVAHYADKWGNLNLNSHIYRFNDHLKNFQLYQEIPTSGARDMEPVNVLGKSFIVVANEASGSAKAKVFGVPSTLFEFIGTKFQAIQTIETYGAVRWKSIKLPSCQGSAVIAYGDQRDTIDQVGFFVYSEGYRRFQKLSLSLYHAINLNFRPQPNTLVPFLISENLYVAIGAGDSTQGYTIYQLEYDKTTNANPWEKKAEQNSAEILYLKENLTLIEKAVEMLEKDVRNIVYKDTKQNITGTKIFKKSLVVDKLNVNKGDVSNGSILFDNGTAKHRADPTKFEFVNLTSMENNESRSEAMFRRLNNSFLNAVMIDRPTNVTSLLHFSNVSLHSSSVAVDNAAIEHCEINDINVCYLANDIVFNNSSDVIHDAKSFSKVQNLKQSLNVHGKINNVKVSREIVLQKKNQSIRAKKTFEDGVVFKSMNVNGNINGIDIRNHVLHLNKDETVFGDKVFRDMLSTENIETEGFIDGVNISKLDKDTLRLTGQQKVHGAKMFNSKETLESKEDLIIRNRTNGLDLDKLAATLVKTDENSSAANGNLIFKDRFQVEGNISASGKMNDLNFPQEAVQVGGRQNITGSKIFNAKITASGDVTAKSLVDGVDLKDVVTLTGNESIAGEKLFRNGLNLTKNIEVAPLRLVDSVDVSQLNEDIMKISKSQNVTGALHFNSIESKHDFAVKDTLDGLPIESYRKLYNDAVLFNTLQNITGSIRFIGGVTIKKNLSFAGLVNGHKITAFLHRFGDQQLENAFNFSNVNIRSNVLVKQLIDNVDVDKLRKDMIRTDIDQSVHGQKTFGDSIKLDGNLTMCCSINKAMLSNLLTKVLQQTIIGAKSFKDFKVTGTLDVMHENVSVETTVDGIDLSNFTGKVIHVTGRLQIDEVMTFNNIIVKSPRKLQVGHINGVNISKLAADIVDLNNNQTILSEKRFTQVATNGNLVAGSTVDGIDVSDLDQEITRAGENGEISGNKEFLDMHAQDAEVAGLIHDVNLTKVAAESVTKSENMEINGSKKISGNVSVGKDAIIGRLNGLNVNEDLVLKSKLQNITGKKIFQRDLRVQGNIEVDGNVNKVDVFELNENSVKKSVEQEISGKKTFEKDLRSNDDVVVQKFVDGVDLSELDAKSAKINGYIVQNGTTVFHDHVNIGENLKVNGKVDGKDIRALAEDAVMIHGSQNITAKKTFERAVAVEKDISIDGDAILDGLLNGINVASLQKDILDTVSDQTIAGQKRFLKTVQINEITGARKLNGYETKELVTVAGNQTVKGVKTFNSSVQAVRDITAARLVDGEDISELRSGTLVTNSLQKQSVTGRKHFTTGPSIESNMTVSGLLDGRIIDKETVLDLGSEQNISGDVKIHKDVRVFKNILLEGTLSGNDLNAIKMDRITLDAHQAIGRNLEVLSSVEARDVAVVGTTNGVHLNQYIPNVNKFTGNAWLKAMLVDRAARKRCSAFDYARSIIDVAPLRIDYFLNFQAFKSGINHIEPFKIGNDSLIAMTFDKQTPCAPTEIMKYHRSKKRFVTHQYLLSASGTRCKSFKSAHETYLVLQNDGQSCQTQSQSTIFKWNTTSSLFQEFQQLLINYVTDVAAITLRSGTTLLAITNAHPVLYTSNVTIWRKLHNETKFCCTQTMVASMASAVTMFEINDLYFLGVAMSLDPGLQSTRALSVIYKLGSNSTWVQLQQIATARASDIRSYNDSQHHFLAIANEKSENTQTHSSQKLGTEVYKYLPAKGLFLLDHSIPSMCPTGIEPFFLKTSHYLAIASKGIGILIYRFRLHFGYQLTLSIPQPGITYVTSFVLDDELHLAVGSSSTTDNGSKMVFHPRLLRAHWSGIRGSTFRGCKHQARR